MCASCCVMVHRIQTVISDTIRKVAHLHVAIMCWECHKTNYLWLFFVCHESTCLSSDQRLSNHWLIYFDAISVCWMYLFAICLNSGRSIRFIYIVSLLKIHVYELGMHFSLQNPIIDEHRFHRKSPVIGSTGTNITMKWWLSIIIFQSRLCIDSIIIDLKMWDN